MGLVGWVDWVRKRWAGQSPPVPPSHAGTASELVRDEGSTSGPICFSGGRLSFRVGLMSTQGNVRESNEDNYYVAGIPSHRVTSGSAENGQLAPPADDVPGLFLVADGMGGQLAGEKASELAVTLIPRKFKRLLGDQGTDEAVQKVIREAVAEANQEILAQSHLIPEFANMGTTVVLALMHNERAYVAGIGDSRAYRLRGGRLELLTQDHSLAQALVTAGTIKPEEGENHRFRNVLYLYLGCKDARGGPEEIQTLELEPGDRFLLTSDGLTGVVRDDVIASILASSDDPQRTAQALVGQALENVSKDNITCLVIHVI